MDVVLVQQLLLLQQADHMEMEDDLGGAGTLGEGALAEEMAEILLAEDQGEVHNFNGNQNN